MPATTRDVRIAFGFAFGDDGGGGSNGSGSGGATNNEKVETGLVVKCYRHCGWVDWQGLRVGREGNGVDPLLRVPEEDLSDGEVGERFFCSVRLGER